jgi:hypothetical protein
MSMSTHLHDLGSRLVGRWSTEATHPALPGTVVPGSAEVEWLEGEQFLVHRIRNDHPDFPDAISLLGDTDGLRMHYFDSRGVHRVYDLAVTPDGWAIGMGEGAGAESFAPGDAPFSQRMTFTFEDSDQTMSGLAQMSYDGQTWTDDLAITYHRTS